MFLEEIIWGFLRRGLEKVLPESWRICLSPLPSFSCWTIFWLPNLWILFSWGNVETDEHATFLVWFIFINWIFVPSVFWCFEKKKRTKSSIKMNKMMWETLKFTLLYTFLHIIILLPILQINHLQVQKRTQNPRIAFGYCSTGSLKTFIHYFGIRKETQSSLYSRHFCANFDPQSILHPRYAHSRNYPWKSTLEVLGGNKT